MKTRNLFLSLFAFAALCACNKEAQPETPAGLENDAYVTVSIVAPSSISTRGESGTTDEYYEGGSAVENKVNNATFIFFKDDKCVQVVTSGLNFKDNVTNTNPFVEKVSEATIIIKQEDATNGVDIAPTNMLVVLNAPLSINETNLKDKSLEEVKGLATNEYASTEAFVMTNSVYASTGVEATNITANIKHTAAEALANPVTVYVERVLAKVTVDYDGIKLLDKDDHDITSTGFDLVLNAHVDADSNPGNDNITIKVKPEILGLGLTKTANTSYLFKKVEDWNIDSWVWDTKNFRSYWANSAATEFTTPTYSSLVVAKDGEGNRPIVSSFYCQENTTETSTNKTSLAVPVQFVKFDDGTSIESFYRCEADYYNEAGLKALAVQMLKGAGVTKGGVEYDASDILITLNSDKQSVKVTTSDANADATNALATMTKVWKWENGLAYYYTNIEHFGTDNASPANKLVGVVRNHVYQLTLNSIKGFGIPVGDDDVEVVPDTPEDEKYEYLAATINILQWKVVNQDVALE